MLAIWMWILFSVSDWLLFSLVFDMIFIEVASTIGKIQPFLTAKMLVFEINKLKAMM